MNKFKIQIKKYLSNLLINFKRERNSKFMFLANSISLKDLLNMLKLELLKKSKIADDYLFNTIVQDLINKKIIHPNGVTIETYSLGELTYYDIHIKTINNRIFSRGTSINKSEAYAKALGEVFERTSIIFPTERELNEKIVNKKVLDVKNNSQFFDLQKYPQPIDIQKEIFPESNVNGEDEFSWTKMTNIFTEQDIYIPSQTVFFGRFSSSNEKNLMQQSTHGAGAGYSQIDAIRSGLFEITHRHFFLNSWYKKLNPQIINEDTVPSNTTLNKKIHTFKNKNFKIHFLNYSSEAKMPTIICILEAFGGWYCGGSTNWTLENAMERSLDEAFSIYLWLSRINLAGNNTVNKKDIDNIQKDFIDLNISNITKKCITFGNKYYIDKIDKFIIKNSENKKENFNENFDIKKENRNIETLKTFAKNNYGEDIFIFNKENNYLSEYNYYVSKVFIPNSYYFAIFETFSRPIIYNQIPPFYTEINPFP